MYHVLLRHLTPRHPPCALRSFSRLLRRPRLSRSSTFCPFRLFQCFAINRSLPSFVFLHQYSLGRCPGFLRVYLSSSYSSVNVPQIESGDSDRLSRRLSLSQNPILQLVVNVHMATKRPGRGQAKTWTSRFPAYVSYVLTVAIVSIVFPSNLYRSNPTLCGDEGTRTPDFRLAKAALSQLSYIPCSPKAGASREYTGPSARPILQQDGPGWTRTIDLSLIRGTL